MIFITIIMIVAFALLYLNTANNLEEKSITAMKDIALSGNGKSPNDIFSKEEKRQSKYSYLSTYTIDYDEHSNTCYVSGFGNVEELTDAQKQYINALIVAVNSQEKNSGILKEYNMRYYYTKTPNGKRIVLLDKLYEDHNLEELLISFAISGTLAFTAFLILSIILAGFVVKPIEKSMKQQQQLISDVSHELKTPITVISTNTDIVLSHNDSTVDNERKWLGYIKDETKRMSDLVSMMLYLAKNDEMVEKPVLSEFNLSNTAYEIALPFESVCFENGKTFNISIEDNINIKGNESSIKQLIVILLDNAVKYSNENGRIDLSLKAMSDKAVLSVFNTGEPIPKANIPYLFDRFYRIDQARSHNLQSGGNGLGLSIAKRIIENNEANISVTSDIERGTTFSCSFNIAKQKNYKQLNK